MLTVLCYFSSIKLFECDSSSTMWTCVIEKWPQVAHFRISADAVSPGYCHCHHGYYPGIHVWTFILCQASWNVISDLMSLALRGGYAHCRTAAVTGRTTSDLPVAKASSKQVCQWPSGSKRVLKPLHRSAGLKRPMTHTYISQQPWQISSALRIKTKMKIWLHPGYTYPWVAPLSFKCWVACTSPDYAMHKNKLAGKLLNILLTKKGLLSAASSVWQKCSEMSENTFINRIVPGTLVLWDSISQKSASVRIHNWGGVWELWRADRPDGPEKPIDRGNSAGATSGSSIRGLSG